MSELEEQLIKTIRTGQIGDVIVSLGKTRNINYVNYYQRTPLIEACIENRPESVKLLLLKDELDINLAPGSQKTSPILWALLKDKNGSHCEIVNLLFNDKRLSAECNQHALLYYAKIGDLEKVKECLASRQCEINYHHPDADNALTNAVEGGHLDVVRYLLSLSVNINATNRFDEPPITIAIRKGFTDIANLVLARNDLNLHQHSGLSGTPLTAAIFYQRNDLAEKLLAKEQTFKDKEHPGALMSTIKNDSPHFLQLLLNKGADINGNSGEEAYEETIDFNDVQINSPFNSAIHPDFDLPIIAALERNKCLVIPTLLERGADLDKKGSSGKSAKELLSDNTQPVESRQLIREWLATQEQKLQAPVGHGTTFASNNSHPNQTRSENNPVLDPEDFQAKTTSPTAAKKP